MNVGNEVVKIEHSTMMGYDSNPVVTQLMRNRSLANLPRCGYTSGLKWNLDPADLTENVMMSHENVSPGDKSD